MSWMVVCSKPFSRNRRMAASRMRLTVSSGYLLRAMDASSFDQPNGCFR